MRVRCALCPSGYNRLLAAFTEADANKDGVLDRSEWAAGAETMSELIHVECRGTSDEYDDVVRCPLAAQQEVTSFPPASPQRPGRRASASTSRPSSSNPKSSPGRSRPGSAQPQPSHNNTLLLPGRSDGGDASGDDGASSGDIRISFDALCEWFIGKLQAQDDTDADGPSEGLARHVAVLDEHWEVSVTSVLCYWHASVPPPPPHTHTHTHTPLHKHHHTGVTMSIQQLSVFFYTCVQQHAANDIELTRRHDYHVSIYVHQPSR